MLSSIPNSRKKKQRKIMASSSVQYPWPSTVNAASFISTKLRFLERGTNYQAWKQQMLCLIEGQDLLGFIDGAISPPRPSIETSSMTTVGGNDYLLWRRSDRLLKGWILGSLHEVMVSEVAALETSRDVWLHLENRFSQLQHKNTSPDHQPQLVPNMLSDQLQLPNMLSSSPLQLLQNISNLLRSDDSDENKQEPEEEDLFMKYTPLHKAALEGDWETAKGIFDRDPQAKSAALDSSGLMPLQVAVGTGKRAIHFVRKMVEVMMLADNGEELMAQTNSTGHTALHIAASVGNTAAATILVSRMPRLLNIPNYTSNDFPVHIAALFTHKTTLRYLLQVTIEQKPYDGNDGLRLLLYVIQMWRCIWLISTRIWAHLRYRMVLLLCGL